jgi:glycosyltransferase involved in cell wall biosynthesis
MRIALLHNIISPHVVPLFGLLAEHAGVSLKVYFLAETESNRRWETTIGERFDYAVLPNWSFRMGREDLFTLFINPTIVSTLIRDGFDVLISVGWDSPAAIAACALARMLHKPIVLWSGSTVHERSLRRSVSLPLVQMLVRASSSWIAYGTRARDYLVQLGATHERIFIAYNTVDVDWFTSRADELRPRRSEIRGELGLDNGPVVLFVGQLIARKGIRDLLSAFALLKLDCPEAQLLLVGYGPLEQELRADVARRQLGGVHFFGHIPIPELPRYYAAADVLALPSHEEVWGLVLNEAAASGLPLVATRVTGGSADLIQDGLNGFSVPPGDPACIAGALRKVFEHADEMGSASRRIIGDRTYSQNVDAIMRAVETAMGKGI